MIANGKIGKPTMYLLFSLFVQFSAIEIRLVFSHAKLVTSSLQWWWWGWWGWLGADSEPL